MNKQEVLNILYDVAFLYRRKKLLEEKFEEMKRDLDIKCVNYETSKISGSKNNVMEDKIINLVEKQKEYMKSLQELYLSKERAENLLESIEWKNKNHHICLEWRYVSCKKWQIIAEKMNYSKDNVYKLHNKALKILLENFE